MSELICLTYNLRPAIGIHLAGNSVGDIGLIINLFRCDRTAICRSIPQIHKRTCACRHSVKRLCNRTPDTVQKRGRYERNAAVGSLQNKFGTEAIMLGGLG